MFSFKNDYSETAHPRILQMMLDTNLVQTDGYSQDPYTAEAISLMKNKLDAQNVDIHIIPGGTQTNVIAISAFLRPHEAVISVESGHINCHETGSIEATGHKILTAPAADGKLTVDLIRQVYEANQEEHTPRPRLVYISNSTELGTIYTKSELSAIYDYCKSHGMFLFMDGARIGSALCCKGNDLTFPDLPKLCDVFYIGGTKNGALIGEALVIVNDELKKDFRWHIKQKGAMLAKGKVLGIQFGCLFQDNLYLELATHANAMADILRDGIRELGYSFLVDSPSNQLFPIFPNAVLAELEKDYGVTFWGKVDETHSAVRLVTSWATPEERCHEFITTLRSLTK